MPLVSVVIPVYNSAKYLRQCVYSVINIDPTKTEIILIDDGSTDDSSRLCDELARHYRTIKVIHQSNAGVSAARNLGIQHSSGDYLYFLDADDITLLHDWQLISDNTDLYIGSYTYGSEQHQIGCHFAYYNTTNPAIGYLKEQIKCCIGSFIVKRNIVNLNHITFPVGIKYGEDQEFILKCLLHSESISFSNKALCFYRTNTESAMYQITTSRFDVALSRIRLLDYTATGYTEVYSYLRSTAIHESLTTVCEGLFRHGMKFKTVWHFLSSNSEIQEFIKYHRITSDLHKYDFVQHPLSLKRLQIRVLKDKYIYQLRCRVSPIKSAILALLPNQI